MSDFDISKYMDIDDGDDEDGVRAPFRWLAVVDFIYFFIGVLPVVTHFQGVDPSFWFAVDQGTCEASLVLISQGPELDVVDLVWALIDNHVLEDVEKVVEVENAEFVSGFDEGN